MKNDVWRVRINHVHVATVHIEGSDTDWSLITKHQELIKECDPEARVTLASEANERGELL